VVDPNTVRRIVAAAGIGPDDVVLEIGPGLGSLTLGLAEVARRVVAIEIDAGLVGALGEVLAGRDDVEVVHADALRTDLGALVDGGPARLVANLPYNVATHLVVRALEDPAISRPVRDGPARGRRAVERPTGRPALRGVSCKLALLAHPEVALTIPRSVFHPVPNVDSVMVRLLRREDAPGPADRARLFALIDAAFAQRRKTLRNNLRRVVDADVLVSAADEADIDLGARAETLGPADLVRLDAALRRRTAG
jgi:16S rRNA (adenine1518-N6/adenine1519-N6)-dimethyltransferase